jgi:site-specific DNA-methyltransferase (adenine-specific)
MPEINLYLGDCMEAMKGMKDNQYDLAIVDPPYGIKQDGRNNHTRGKKAKSKDYRNNNNYDCSAPNAEYFDLLQRKSKNQIIFGANHFIDNMPFNVSSSCWVVWDKLNGLTDFADCELAWTSFTTAVRKFNLRWQGMLRGEKGSLFHPNQKPVALYKWLLKNYAKEGDKILDTHGGSMSIALACHDMKFDLDLYELDEDYYNAGFKRYQQHIKQLSLF